MTTPVVKMVVAYVTVPTMNTAKYLAKTTVSEGLVACANIIPGCTSVYSWKGQVETDEECVILMKTIDSNVEKLQKRIQKLHPAETPCFFTMPIDKISEGFGKWLHENTQFPSSPRKSIDTMAPVDHSDNTPFVQDTDDDSFEKQLNM